MKKTIITAIVTVCMLLICLTACKSGDKGKSKKTGSSSDAGTTQSSYEELPAESAASELSESNTSSKKGNTAKSSGKSGKSSPGSVSSKSGSSNSQSGGTDTAVEPGEIDESLNGEWI